MGTIALPAHARDTLLDGVRTAGRILLDHFGRVSGIRQKESPASIVTDADLAAERHLIQHLLKHHPGHGILAEESGLQPGDGEFTWVIDPLDGTSNFVAGLPWWGTQAALLHGLQPVLAAMYLPLSDELYWAEAGQGAFRGETRLVVPSESDPKQILCAFGFDAGGPPDELQRALALFGRVAAAVRNTRATNSLVDFCYTLEGRLGACVNLHPKLWDIAPMSLILPEAGGRISDLEGRPLAFSLASDDVQRVYPIAGASTALHPHLVALTCSSAG